LVRVQFKTVLRVWINTVFWVQSYTLLRVQLNTTLRIQFYTVLRVQFNTLLGVQFNTVLMVHFDTILWVPVNTESNQLVTLLQGRKTRFRINNDQTLGQELAEVGWGGE
jgi:hypothetical protein